MTSPAPGAKARPSSDMLGRLALAPASPDQAGAIRDLTLRAYAKWVPVTPRKPRPMTADYARAVIEHRFDCLWSGDRLVGRPPRSRLGHRPKRELWVSGEALRRSSIDGLRALARGLSLRGGSAEPGRADERSAWPANPTAATYRPP